MPSFDPVETLKRDPYDHLETRHKRRAAVDVSAPIAPPAPEALRNPVGSDRLARAMKRTSSGRFEPRLDLHTLADAVAAIARTVDPLAPERVTQRAYDAARAGYPSAPRAEQTAKRFGLPWPEVLKLVLSDLDLTLSLTMRRQQRGRQFDANDVHAALSTVACELKTTKLSLNEYLHTRDRILVKARLAWLHRSEPVLPSLSHLYRTVGSWTEALKLAGLESPPQSQKGISIPEAIELCLEAHGALPTTRELDLFARVNGFALASPEPTAQYLVALRVRRETQGKWTPRTVPPLKQRPDYSRPVELGDVITRSPRKRQWTREDCIEALIRLIEETPKQQRVTQNRYHGWARGRGEVPSLGSVDRRGGFRELLAEARRRLS